MKPAHTLVVEFQAMSSPCSLHIVGNDDAAMRAAATAAMQEVHRIELKYSRYRPDSIVSRINQSAGHPAPVDVDEETAGLLAFADQLWQHSDGLFDITSGVLRTVWDFKNGKVPTPEALFIALNRVGWDKVALTPTSVRLTQPGMELDFGGFGKEYAADRAAAVLRQHRVQQALVNLGGDLHALRNPHCAEHPAWNVAIQHPRPPAEHPQAKVATIQLAQGGMATSGDYERFFESDGQRYCHILNPITGWPVVDFQSVTVIAENTTTAGALATIAMLKGSPATDWLGSQHAAYLAVNRHGQLQSTTPAKLDPTPLPPLETTP
jgi:FAD:protein FMN transferase